MNIKWYYLRYSWLEWSNRICFINIKKKSKKKKKKNFTWPICSIIPISIVNVRWNVTFNFAQIWNKLPFKKKKKNEKNLKKKKFRFFTLNIWTLMNDLFVGTICQKSINNCYEFFLSVFFFFYDFFFYQFYLLIDWYRRRHLNSRSDKYSTLVLLEWILCLNSIFLFWTVSLLPSILRCCSSKKSHCMSCNLLFEKNKKKK